MFISILPLQFNGNFSPKSCELMWKNLMHPTINRGSWSKAEDEVLERLAAAAGYRYWDAVADELGTDRTGFLCFHRYQSKNSHASDKRKWTSAEDDRLKQVVDKCRINNYVPWAKVAYYMHKRTKEQCFQRYTYSLRDKLRKGPFSEHEDFIVMIGVRIFGEANWAKIADFLPRRTAQQIHARYNNFLKPNFKSWTPKDDFKLLKLVKMHGAKDWVKIAGEFGAAKTRTQCRNRFYVIYNWYQKDPDNFNLNKMRSSTLQKKRQSEINNKLEATLTKFLQKQQSAREEESAMGYKKKDPKGYHVTPEGVKIPISDLYEFMNELQQRLPDATHFPTYLERRTPVLSSLRLGMHEPKPLLVKRTKAGKVVTVEKVAKGRSAFTGGGKTRKLNPTLIQYMRPAWLTKPGRKRVVYADSEIDATAAATVEASAVLKSDDDQADIQPADPLEDEIQQRYLRLKDEAKAATSGQQGSSQVSPLNLRMTPAIKTYSRKKKVVQPSQDPVVLANSCDNAQSPLRLLPPNRSTLVGLRGLLLHQRALKAASLEPEGVGRNVLRYRPDVYKTLQEGIYEGAAQLDAHHPHFNPLQEKETATLPNDPMIEPIERPSDEEREADELLFQRLKSLFFWPMVMTSTK